MYSPDRTECALFGFVAGLVLATILFGMAVVLR
jgi:hypothetical protein